MKKYPESQLIRKALAISILFGCLPLENLALSQTNSTATSQASTDNAKSQTQRQNHPTQQSSTKTPSAEPRIDGAAATLSAIGSGFGAKYPLLPDGTLVLCPHVWSDYFGKPLPNKAAGVILDVMLWNGITAEWLIKNLTDYNKLTDKFDQRDYMAKELPAAQQELKRLKQFKSVEVFLHSSATHFNFNFEKGGYPCNFMPFTYAASDFGFKISNEAALPKFVAVPIETARKFQGDCKLIIAAKGELVFENKGDNSVAAKIKILEGTIHLIDFKVVMDQVWNTNHTYTISTPRLEMRQDVTLQELKLENVPEPKKTGFVAP